MKYLTFVIIALTARVYIVASICRIPIICDGIPYWMKMETTCRKDTPVAEMKKLMKNDLDELTDQTTDMSNQLKDLEKKLEELKLRKSARNSPCIYKYNSTLCYWAEVKDKWNTDYADAVKICENQRSEIGQIYNNEIYDEVTKILRQRLPEVGTHIHAWIGLTIDTKTGKPTYPSSIAFTRWYPDRPFGDDDKTNVALEVRSDENSAYQGMFNYSPSGKLINGVVCQVRTG